MNHLARPSAPAALPSVDEARAFGAHLRPVDPGLLRQRPGIRSRWWVCDERYIEVSVDDDDGPDPLLVEVAVRGRIARFRRDRGVSTSSTEELEGPGDRAGAVPSSRLETGDAFRRADVVAVAAALLGAAPDDTLRGLARLFAAPVD